jgi:hypothetical protein
MAGGAVTVGRNFFNQREEDEALEMDSRYLFISFSYPMASDFPKGPINYMNPFNPVRWTVAAGPCSLHREKPGSPFRHPVSSRRGWKFLLVKTGCSKPDGYTIGDSASSHHSSTHVHRDVAFKTDDFVILSIGSIPHRFGCEEGL